MNRLQQYHPFFLLQSSRNFKAGDYRFGFNGKEQENKVKGTGYEQDYGSRIYDPRLGRWLSLDPLQAKYPGFGPYNFCADNPIMFVEVDGRYFTGNTATVKAVYAIVCQLAASGNERAIAFKAALEKMDESDVEFYIQNSKGDTRSDAGTGGMTSFDFDNNRVVIDVYTFKGDDHSIPYEARGGHEFEHGDQFLEGEIGFTTDGKAWKYLQDEGDEEKAFLIQMMIENSMMKADEKQKTNADAKAAAKKYNLPTTTNKLTPEQKESLKNSKYFKIIDNYTPTEKQKKEKKSILKDSQNKETPENTPNNEEHK